MSITKQDLKQGSRLKLKDSHKLSGAEQEIEVVFAGDANVVVKTPAGAEIVADYAMLGSMYEVVPDVIPTQENFLPRLKDELEHIIAHLSAFNSYQASTKTADHNMIQVGTKLFALKEEVTKYVEPESAVASVPKGLEGLLKKTA
ncbi:MAG: hypothetical protein PHY47_00880 [Lachnospiraceae bacterium]|nr:hypothetical protein [Lachnospiraceae bacterium]